jgi:rod shape-determining protein MreC
MLTAHYSARYRSLYAHLNWVILPVQKLVDMPFHFYQSMHDWITTKSKLIDTNKRLQLDLLRLQAQSQELLAFKKENAQFRQLFRSKLYIGGQVEAAKLLAIRLNSISQEAVLDKGSKQKVYVGQPILDGYGVLGQIIEVAPLTSKVLFITDARFAIPVENYRTGMKAIAMGSGHSHELTLVHVMDASDIKAGDLFVSSGLALRFPVSYPVGVVTKVSQRMGDKFLSVTLAPSAHVMQSTDVLLNWPALSHLQSNVKKQWHKPLMMT